MPGQVDREELDPQGVPVWLPRSHLLVLTCSNTVCFREGQAHVKPLAQSRYLLSKPFLSPRASPRKIPIIPGLKAGFLGPWPHA